MQPANNLWWWKYVRVRSLPWIRTLFCGPPEQRLGNAETKDWALVRDLLLVHIRSHNLLTIRCCDNPKLLNIKALISPLHCFYICSRGHLSGTGDIPKYSDFGFSAMLKKLVSLQHHISKLEATLKSTAFGDVILSTFRRQHFLRNRRIWEEPLGQPVLL
jgi:hypothetical protein